MFCAQCAEASAYLEINPFVEYGDMMRGTDKRIEVRTYKAIIQYQLKCDTDRGKSESISVDSLYCNDIL